MKLKLKDQYGDYVVFYKTPNKDYPVTLAQHSREDWAQENVLLRPEQVQELINWLTDSVS